MYVYVKTSYNLYGDTHICFWLVIYSRLILIPNIFWYLDMKFDPEKQRYSVGAKIIMIQVCFNLPFFIFLLLPMSFTYVKPRAFYCVCISLCAVLFLQIVQLCRFTKSIASDQTIGVTTAVNIVYITDMVVCDFSQRDIHYLGQSTASVHAFL